MKKLLLLALALMLVFALAACGGGETAGNGEKPTGGIADIDGGDKDSDDSSANTPNLSWPSAEFITPGMEYTGGGTITYVDYIDGSTQEGGVSQYGVYINGATIEDAKSYIDALKADGFTFFSAGGLDEPEVAFDFGYFRWTGEADGGNRFVTIYVGEEADTYGMSGAEYTMSILMEDQNMYK